MLKKIHKIVGLSVALIIIHLAITGILLMYPSTFKLQNTFISNNYVLSLYNMYQTTDVFYNKDYSNVGIVSKKVIIDDYVIDTGLEKVLNIAKYKKQIFISSYKNLLLINNEEYEPTIIKKGSNICVFSTGNILVNIMDALDKNKLYDGQDYDNMYMTSLIQMIIDNLMIVKPVFINGGWIEIDSVEDMNMYNSHGIKF